MAFVEISKRTFKNFARNKTLFLNRLIVKIFSAVLTCLLYYKTDDPVNKTGKKTKENHEQFFFVYEIEIALFLFKKLSKNFKFYLLKKFLNG